ncbi:MAG: family oxidoreductase [Devosia sp.]|nr:family oxidoreductase [Devosia sp.]
MTDTLAGRTLLVAGGAGLIGQHLVRALLARAATVIVADNLSTGRQSAVAAFADNPNYRFIHHDITTPLEVEVDGIYNLACPASPRAYQADPIATWRASVIGTANLATLAERRSIRLLHASTSEVYGDPLQHPQAETYFGNVNPIGVRACYDEGKRAAETLLSDLARLGRADIRIARIFNTYGPGMTASDGRVVSNFIVQALAGAPVTIYGSGEQTRSPCYVADTVAGLIALYTSDSGPEPINIGNPEEITVRALAETIIERCDSRSTLTFEPLPADDPHRRCPDITRARDRLGWVPTTPLLAGLDGTIAWFRQTDA